MLTFDLETDGLLAEVSRIHCLVIHDDRTDSYTRYSKSEVVQGLQRLSEAGQIAGHNIIAFDLPVIRKLYPGWTFHGSVLDTLVWARVTFSDIRNTDFGLVQKGALPGQLVGSHSLEAWGHRLRVLKGDYGKQEGAWEAWTPELVEYCQQDVKVTTRLIEWLGMQDVQAPEAVNLEHKVATIISRQERNGFLFNRVGAEQLYTELLLKKEELGNKLRSLFPLWYSSAGEFTPKVNSKKFHYTIGAAVTKVELNEFNPGSRQHIAYWLKRKYGWEPVEFAEQTGAARIDETILSDLPYPEAKELCVYLTLIKRLGQLAEGDQAWLKAVGPDGRMHGYVNTCGAVTGRMTHHHPNMAQVPAVYSPYGKECRALFATRPGFKLVGADASGLEARCLAHYLARFDGGEYGKAVVEGKKEDGTDVHTINMKALGITSRDTAKTWFYAWCYGAGQDKLGKILGVDAGKAKKLAEKFLANLPALAQLKASIDERVKKPGYLKGLDGRKLPIRSAHSALNTLLQSAGAVIMKKALVLLDTELQRQGWKPGREYEFVANIHDEWQAEVQEELAETFGQLSVQAIRVAGEHFNFRCALDGEYKIGNNWAETH